MDYIVHEAAINSPTVFTSNVQHNDVLLHQKAKVEAFQMMDQLEGWCSKLKATILMDIIFGMQPKVVVEIGVFGGKSFVPMAQALKYNGSGIAYGIDPWTKSASSVGMEKENLDYWGKLDHDMILTGLIKKIREFRLENQISLIRKTSADAAPINNIDMIHIDGNHSEETSFIDVCKWVPLVRKGGIIIFDDLDWHTTGRAVQWLNENCEKVTEVRDTNIWGIWVKK